MEYSTWQPKKSSWNTRKRRAWLTVRTPFVHLFITHLGPRIFQACNSWLTQAANKSDKPLDSPLHKPLWTWIGSADSHTVTVCYQVSSLSWPQCSAVAIARQCMSHLAITRKDMPATVLHCYSHSNAIQRRLAIARTASTWTCHVIDHAIASTKPFKQWLWSRHKVRPYEECALCGGDESVAIS